MVEMKTVNLGEIISFKNGKKRPSEEGHIPVYGGNGILGYTSANNYNNCIAIGRVGAYCGSVYYEPQKCWISDNAIAALPNEDIDIYYAYYLLKSHQDYFCLNYIFVLKLFLFFYFFVHITLMIH